MSDNGSSSPPKIEAKVERGSMEECDTIELTVQGGPDEDLGDVEDAFDDRLDRLLEERGDT